METGAGAADFWAQGDVMERARCEFQPREEKAVILNLQRNGGGKGRERTVTLWRNLLEEANACFWRRGDRPAQASHSDSEGSAGTLVLECLRLKPEAATCLLREHE